eukprot:3254662-Rhodomonas_salina.1
MSAKEMTTFANTTGRVKDLAAALSTLINEDVRDDNRASMVLSLIVEIIRQGGNGVTDVEKEDFRGLERSKTFVDGQFSVEKCMKCMDDALAFTRASFNDILEMLLGRSPKNLLARNGLKKAFSVVVKQGLTWVGTHPNVIKPGYPNREFHELALAYWDATSGDMAKELSADVQINFRSQKLREIERVYACMIQQQQFVQAEAEPKVEKAEKKRKKVEPESTGEIEKVDSESKGKAKAKAKGKVAAEEPAVETSKVEEAGPAEAGAAPKAKKEKKSKVQEAASVEADPAPKAKKAKKSKAEEAAPADADPAPKPTKAPK